MILPRVVYLRELVLKVILETVKFNIKTDDLRSYSVHTPLIRNALQENVKYLQSLPAYK